ncbi:hypothetical protein [Methanocalculus sp. MSAO_Arc2]|uniref:hypothetical protein n=1 Tax=Methanocalculus sp. MSAO_Arc2 TaxID=2293855 RepID=UPI0032176CA0
MNKEDQRNAMLNLVIYLMMMSTTRPKGGHAIAMNVAGSLQTLDYRNVVSHPVFI